MSATPDSTLADPQHIIADLRRELDECRAELDKRTAERDEALEQQTATAEVLQVINSSPGNLTPVFDAILEKVHSLCGIAFSALQLYDGTKFRAGAVRGVPGPLADVLRQPFEFPPGSPPSHLLAGEPFVQIADMAKVAEQRPDNPRAQATAEHGLHTVLFMPRNQILQTLRWREPDSNHRSRRGRQTSSRRRKILEFWPVTPPSALNGIARVRVICGD
jgi:hypothetical protein